MKRVTILALCFIAAAGTEAGVVADPLYPNSTLDLDDNTAGQLVVAGKARSDKDAKLKNTTKEHETAIDERVKVAAVSPMEAMAAAMAKSMATEFAKLLPKPEPAKAGAGA